MKLDVTKQPVAIILIQMGLIMGLSWYRHMVNPMDVEVTPVMGLAVGDWVNGMVAKCPRIGDGISIFLSLVTSFIVVRTISRKMIFPYRTYLPALFYVVVSYGVYYTGQNLSSTLAALLMAWTVSMFASSFIRAESFGRTFRAAFLLGITPMLHPSAVVFLVLVPIAMGVFKRGRRESAVAIIGSVMPLFVCAYITWGLGGGFSDVFVGIWHYLTASTTGGIITSTTRVINLVTGGLMVLIVLLSIYTFATTSGRMRIKPYKIMIYTMLFFVVTLLPMLLPSRSISELPIIAIPTAFIAPMFFVRYKGRIPTTIYILLMVSLFGGLIMNLY